MQPSGVERAWDRVLLPVLLCAFGVAAGATLTHPAASATDLPLKSPPEEPKPSRTDLQRVKVEDVVLTDSGGIGAVLLVAEGGDTVIPLFGLAAEGRKVRQTLRRDGPVSAPGLQETVAGLGGSVARVECETAREELRCAVVVNVSGHETVLDAPWAEALALALTTERPVFAAAALVRERGFKKADAPTRAGELPSRLRLPEAL